MPRGGKNRSGGEKKFARASRAQDSIFLPPLGNFSCTPLYIYIYFKSFYYQAQYISIDLFIENSLYIFVIVEKN